MENLLIPISKSKKVFLFALTGLIIYLAGNLFAINWLGFLFNTKLVYSTIIKLIISFTATVMAFMILKNGLGKWDTIPLVVAFVFSFLGDNCVVLSIDLFKSHFLFQIGGVLFCISQGALIIRQSKGFKFLTVGFTPKKLIFPLFFYLPLVFIFIAFYPLLVKADLVLVAAVYTPIFTTSLWTAWETVHSKLLPRPNAWMAAIGMTSFFIMELIGAVYNAGMGTLGEISFIFTWFFYIPALVLFALSGYNWKQSTEATLHGTPKDSLEQQAVLT